MSRQNWIERLRQELAEADSEGNDEVQFVIGSRPEWRVAESQRSAAYELGEDYGYSRLERSFTGESMVWTFRR